MIYVGRFAPSPSGPLHFGSLVAALGSFLDARRHGGRWLVRVEDLDPPREVPGATKTILDTLERLGLLWDGPVVYQSQRTAHYEEALERLRAADLCYPCICTRKKIREATSIPTGGKAGPIYPGTCRNGIRRGRDSDYSLRMRTPPETVAVEDRLQGRLEQLLARDCGDFIVRRRDGHFAYQLAVVVDDYQQGVSHVVRGTDLLDSTPRQIYLQRLLRYAEPRYMHLPIAVNAQSQKLSKQTRAAPVQATRPERALFQALEFLRQKPPAALAGEKKEEILGWATQHWNPSPLRRIIKIQI